ncbi:hypothetical protein [Avibacterium gallinarum]|uniref:hypothetical protein n=1 Tax=Avibacterium gallinarum TaxID=755 RepID=UPI0039FCBEE1
MINVSEKLLEIKKERELNYISLIELVELLKSTSQTSTYPEIACFLNVSFAKCNPNNADENLWGQEAFDEWYSKNGIAIFELPKSLAEPPRFLYWSLLFDALKEGEEGQHYLEQEFISPDFEDTAKDLFSEKYHNISMERRRVDELLSIDTYSLKKAEIEKELYSDKQTLLAMAMTKTDEFVQNTDINKSPVGLAESVFYESQIENKDSYIKELEAQIEQLQQNKNPLNQTIANQDSRISQAKRDLFSLLVMNCYPNYQSRNALFEALNADLREKGIRQADIQYPTFDRLIDERLRINNKSPFPPKQK